MQSEPVYFYEHEFYVLSNFSSFMLEWKSLIFQTSEHAYHWEKFVQHPEIQQKIIESKSAHDAFKISREYEDKCLSNWEDIRLNLMIEICRAKINQHPYVMKKLLQTGDRIIIEDSWRDDFWGWGPNKDGQNQLGKIWMKIRDEIKPKNALHQN